MRGGGALWWIKVIPATSWTMDEVGIINVDISFKEKNANM